MTSQHNTSIQEFEDRLRSQLKEITDTFVPALRPFRTPFGALGASIILHDTVQGVKHIRVY